jgi:hypothetical protein
MKTPATYYEPSPRAFPEELPEIVYPPHFETRRVNISGYILINKHKYYISWVLPEETVGLEEMDDGKWLLHFGPLPLALIDTTTKKIRPLPFPEARQRKRKERTNDTEEANEAE